MQQGSEKCALIKMDDLICRLRFYFIHGDLIKKLDDTLYVLQKIYLFEREFKLKIARKQNLGENIFFS